MLKDSNIEYESIFRAYSRYKCASFNSIMSFDNQIFKFKDRVNSYLKSLKEMESKVSNKSFNKLNNEVIHIVSKEGKEKKIYTIDPKSEEENPKKNKKINSEPNLYKVDSKSNNSKENKEKIFTVLGGYKDISNAIAKRGWKECKDPSLKTYDLLYTLKIADIPFTELNNDTIVNHFKKVGEVTRKGGLLKNLRNLYFENVCPDDFYPRGYDLTDKQDVEDFMEDFKTSKAIAILRKCQELNGQNVNKEEVITALNIVKKKFGLLTGTINLSNKFQSVKQRIFSKTYVSNSEFHVPMISDKEWEIISNENMSVYHQNMNEIIKAGMLTPDTLNKIKSKKKIITKYEKNEVSKKNNIVKNKNIPTQKIVKQTIKKTEEDKKLEEEIKKCFKDQEKERELNKKKLDQEILENDLKKQKEKELEEKAKLEKEKKKEEEEEKKPLTKEEQEQKWKEETFINNTTHHERPPRLPQTDNVSEILPEINNILSELSKTMPQYIFEGSSNIWIVKPGGLSRGRGVNCIDQLNDILSNIKPGNQTVIQKYIENPLIIKKKKFDIRQWVVMSDINPLTLYMYDTPYIRFGAEEYNINDFKNVFSQLTGNSIAKHSTQFNKSEIEGDMWETEQFREYIKTTYGKDHWPEIQEKIKKIIIFALESAKHKIFDRKNCFELFGFDIMVDELLNVYLIEINMSPDWTYSTKVTEKLVKSASDDIMKIILDIPQENLKPVNERKKIDTGLFKLIYSSEKFPEFKEMYINKKY